MKIQVATCKANKTQQQQQRMRHILPAEEGGRRRRGEGDGTKHGMAHSNPKQNFLFSHTRWPKSKKYSRQILLYEYPQAHERTQRGVQRGAGKGCQKLLAKWGKSAKIATRITVKIIIEISCKQSERQTAMLTQ